ncbi:myb-like protein X [Anneissia japonica]|uniref:myb-like protein X n=1 Tax=Anneissia japonica TaxID=1529436 RepID=UPI001425A781|nr:myb-like protein X [Anneissia japonica]
MTTNNSSISSDRTISSIEHRSRHKEKEELVESDEELITSSDDYVPENASNGDNNVDRSEKEKEFDESQTPGKQKSKEISNKAKVNHGMVTVMTTNNFSISGDRTISSIERRSRHKEKEELVESDEELITSSDDYVPGTDSDDESSSHSEVGVSPLPKRSNQNVVRSEKEKEFDESQTPGKQNSKEISNKSKVNHGMVTVMTTNNSSISSDRTISSIEHRSRHKEKEELVESDEELITSSDDYVPENASNGDNNVDRSEKEKEFDESQTPETDRNEKLCLKKREPTKDTKILV